MGNKKISILSIVLYVLAGILALYTVWCMINVNEYIAGQQVTFKGNEYTVINFYMSNGGQFGIYAVILFALGWILQTISPKIDKIAAVSDEPSTFSQEEIVEEAEETEILPVNTADEIESTEN